MTGLSVTSTLPIGSFRSIWAACAPAEPGFCHSSTGMAGLLSEPPPDASMPAAAPPRPGSRSEATGDSVTVPVAFTDTSRMSAPNGFDRNRLMVLLVSGMSMGASPASGAAKSAEPLAWSGSGPIEAVGFGIRGSQTMSSPLAETVALMSTATSDPPSFVGV